MPVHNFIIFERIHGVAQVQDNPSAYDFKKKSLFGFIGDVFECDADNSVQGIAFSLLELFRAR